MTARISVFDAPALEALRREQRLDPQHVRALRNAYMKAFAPPTVALAPFPAREHVDLGELALHQRLDSALDGATKLLLRGEDGLVVETVLLRPRSGRSTVCVSSQVGCAAACRFCATGTMGIARSLGVPEILAQVVLAGQLLASEGRRLRNVVFMGMGEPLHNEENVSQAIAALVDPACFNLSPDKLMVSSVGVIPGMLRLAERFPRVGIALSLHSARASVREQLLPLAKRYPLDALRDAVAALNAIQARPVMIEYLLLAGLTDTDADLDALLAWTEGLAVHLNLIPYNPVASAPELVGTDATRSAWFAAGLKQAGRTTTLRRSLGRDVDAACGQLVTQLSLSERRRPHAPARRSPR